VTPPVLTFGSCAAVPGRSVAAILAILSGCQPVRSGPDTWDCPPLPTHLLLVREEGTDRISINAQVNRSDGALIGAAKLFLRKIESADTSSRVLSSDATGHAFGSDFNPGRYHVVARGIGVGPRTDTLDLRQSQSVRLTYTLSPEPFDRCGPDVAIVRPPRPR